MLMRKLRYYLLIVFECFEHSNSIQRAFAVTSAGIKGGGNLAESAKDLERARKAINVQLADFDNVKKSLVRDLQNRCEKVCLEMVNQFFPGSTEYHLAPKGRRTGNSTRRDQGTVQQRDTQQQ